MDLETFESLDDRLFEGEDKKQKGAGLYQPKEVTGIAPRLTFVLFDEIKEASPAQSRREVFDPDKHKEDLELLNSIKANGIITPIIVRKIGTEDIKQGKREFALVAGHRRVAAGKSAGLKGTAGEVCKPGDDHEKLTFVENSGRRELSSFEKSLSLQSLKEERGFSDRRVAKETGLSKSYVNELMQALQAPEELRTIWAEGDITPKALILLKDHWPLLGQKESAPLLKGLHGLSRLQASSLGDQLSAGTPLKRALSAINSSGKSIGSGPRKSSLGKSSQGNKDVSISKNELLTEISEVFPRIKEKQARVLYDYAVVDGIKDPEVLWAAALFVDRGGNINKAVELASGAMKRRSTKGLVTKEVNLMKKVACEINKMKKEDKSIIEFINIVFSSRR